LTDGSTVDDEVNSGKGGETVYEAFSCGEVYPEVFDCAWGGGGEFGCSGGVVRVGDLCEKGRRGSGWCIGRWGCNLFFSLFLRVVIC